MCEALCFITLMNWTAVTIDKIVAIKPKRIRKRMSNNNSVHEGHCGLWNEDVDGPFLF